MFVWTTGAWLIWDHLHARPAAEVAAARARDRARPDPLARAALHHPLRADVARALPRRPLLRQELDRRFGRTTIAAKMTDVPGHTLGIVPLLAEAGVRFLHLGVNTASPPPDVPDALPLARARRRGGRGDVPALLRRDAFPRGLRRRARASPTPTTTSGRRACRRRPRPIATSPASTPDARDPRRDARGLRAPSSGSAARAFPVVELELGDSWIHGAASDPVKLARFRALQRLYDRFEAEGLDAAAPRLRPRPDAGRRAYLGRRHQELPARRDGLGPARLRGRAPTRDHRFAYTEASWAEQRAYLDAAVAALAPADRSARRRRARRNRPPPPAPHRARREPSSTLGGWRIELDPATGDVARHHQPPRGAARRPGRQPDRLPPRELRRRRRGAAHGQLPDAPRRNGRSSTTTSPASPAPRTARSAAFAPVLRGTAGRATVVADMPRRRRRRPRRARLARARLRADADGLCLTLRLRGQAGQPHAGGRLPLLHARGRRRLALPQDRPLAPGGQCRRRAAAASSRRSSPPRPRSRPARARDRPARHRARRARGRRTSWPSRPSPAGLRPRASASTSTTTSGAPTSRCGGRATCRRDS